MKFSDNIIRKNLDVVNVIKTTSEMEARQEYNSNLLDIERENAMGIIFTCGEIEELNEKGYLKDYQLLDDNGGYPFGNCVIVLAAQFKDGEIEELGLSDRVEEVYYTREFEDEYADLDFSGKWWAKGCTGEAIFADYSDFEMLV